MGKINSGRVWTIIHDEKIEDTKIKDLRLASVHEVNGYLNDRSMPVGSIVRAAIDKRVTLATLPPLPSS